MPNFEEQIAKWRRSMVEASVYRTDLLDELEEHLREEIERLLRSGTPENGVFEKAVSNLGGPSALASEFEKLSAGSAANWLPVKIARFVVISATIILAAVLIPRI